MHGTHLSGCRYDAMQARVQAQPGSLSQTFGSPTSSPWSRRPLQRLLAQQPAAWHQIVPAVFFGGRTYTKLAGHVDGSLESAPQGPPTLAARPGLTPPLRRPSPTPPGRRPTPSCTVGRPAVLPAGHRKDDPSCSVLIRTRSRTGHTGSMRAHAGCAGAAQGSLAGPRPGSGASLCEA